MITHYATDTGKVRSHNEDSVTIVKNKSNEYFLIVADGMGGHKAGEVASSLVVTALGSRWSNIGSIGTKVDAVKWLSDITHEVNLNILKYAEEHIDSQGLGTTCVCAIYTKDYLIFGNIGDSSGFVKKGEHLYKVTKDHTLVNVLIASGEIRPEEAENHPQKNVLMKALGACEHVEADIFDVEHEIDGIFLCSDGLTNMLTQEQIEKVLNDPLLNVQEQIEKLIKKANLRGGTDNISIAYAVNNRSDL
ncbi:MAG: Stp1/IreP family PP2C-type Ser/Thr phosphatase [Bacilli bacterium]